MPKKDPNPVDHHVGARVRARRILLGMSQEKLGDALGVTFQQVQKYEKGTNRIGASRLENISRVLEVPPAYFFENIVNGNAGMTGFAEDAARAPTHNFATPAEGLNLNKAFSRIADAKVRKHILELVESLADEGGRARKLA